MKRSEDQTEEALSGKMATEGPENNRGSLRGRLKTVAGSARPATSDLWVMLWLSTVHRWQGNSSNTKNGSGRK
jgi:hypothetical protein